MAGRFQVSRLEGLGDDPRPAVPRKITDEQVELVITKTLEETRPGWGHALVDPVDGGRDGDEPGGNLADLARLWA
jgi:hypothetical protein